VDLEAQEEMKAMELGIQDGDAVELPELEKIELKKI
jgi:hypothetical protein